MHVRKESCISVYTSGYINTKSIKKATNHFTTNTSDVLIKKCKWVIVKDAGGLFRNSDKCRPQMKKISLCSATFYTLFIR